MPDIIIIIIILICVRSRINVPKNELYTDQCVSDGGDAVAKL